MGKVMRHQRAPLKVQSFNVMRRTKAIENSVARRRKKLIGLSAFEEIVAPIKLDSMCCFLLQ